MTHNVQKGLHSRKVVKWWEEDSFIPFLYWLAGEKYYTAEQIVDVVEKPWKWEEEWEEYYERDE